jgi:hypothetical protein
VRTGLREKKHEREEACRSRNVGKTGPAWEASGTRILVRQATPRCKNAQACRRMGVRLALPVSLRPRTAPSWTRQAKSNQQVNGR